MRRIGSILALIVMCFGFCCACAEKTEPLPFNAEVIIDMCENERRTVPTNNGYFSQNFWRENKVDVGWMLMKLSLNM